MKIKKLYNPFIYIAGVKSLVIGIISLAITTLLAYLSGTHFGGLFTINFAKDADYWFFAAENTIHWLFLSAFIYVSGVILSKSRIRFIDILGTALMSRMPLMLTPLFRTLPVFESFMVRSWEMYVLIVIYVISLVWTLILLFNAIKVSCNLKNDRLTIAYILCLLLSEICTQVAVYILT